MSPAAIPAVPRHRNVAVLTLAQALFMSVQGMAIATTPLAGYMLLRADEKWLVVGNQRGRHGRRILRRVSAVMTRPLG